MATATITSVDPQSDGRLSVRYIWTDGVTKQAGELTVEAGMDLPALKAAMRTVGARATTGKALAALVQMGQVLDLTEAVPDPPTKADTDQRAFVATLADLRRLDRMTALGLTSKTDRATLLATIQQGLTDHPDWVSAL